MLFPKRFIVFLAAALAGCRCSRKRKGPGLIERDILTHGDPQTSTTRCAVLANTNYVSYATLAARGGIAAMKLQGQQEIFYVVSGRGTVTSAGETSELYDGVGILVPPGVEFSMKNTGDADLNMYIINELDAVSSQGHRVFLVTSYGGRRLEWVTSRPFADGSGIEFSTVRIASYRR